MADVNRRVFEEPWFGKPVADILMDRQQNPMQRDRNVDQEAAQVEPAEHTTIHGKQEQQEPQKEQGKDTFWDDFFGKQQAAEQEQAHQQEQGR